MAFVFNASKQGPFGDILPTEWEAGQRYIIADNPATTRRAQVVSFYAKQNKIVIKVWRSNGASDPVDVVVHKELTSNLAGDDRKALPVMVNPGQILTIEGNSDTATGRGASWSSYIVDNPVPSV